MIKLTKDVKAIMGDLTYIGRLANEAAKKEAEADKESNLDFTFFMAVEFGAALALSRILKDNDNKDAQEHKEFVLEIVNNVPEEIRDYFLKNLDSDFDHSNCDHVKK